MAIGRTFAESLQKALRSLETGLDRRSTRSKSRASASATTTTSSAARSARRLARPVPQGRAGDAARHEHRGDIYEAARSTLVSSIASHEIVELEARVRAHGLPADAGQPARAQGGGLFRCAPGDARRAVPRPRSAGAATKPRDPARLQAHRYLRGRIRSADRLYVFDLRDALRRQGELRGTPSDRRQNRHPRRGPNRIGQGIEFDYCCCHACFALSEAGFETIMINCNPETVSTDYDTSDRLYFEPLTAEDVLEILDKERENGTLKGVIVQFGGQTPLKLAHGLEQVGRADPRHLGRFDRPRRGPRPVQAPSRQARPQAAEERHRLFGRAGAAGGGRSRPAARGAPVLCAWRPGHGDHP